MTRRPKVSKKTLLRIVDEVYKRPCLWNPDDLHHNSRGRVAIAWEEIAAILNLPESLLRAKWKSIRDIFKREMKRCKTNAKGEMQYTGKWRHFKLMYFLHNPKEAQQIHTVPKDVSNSSAEQESDIKEEVLDNDDDMDESDDNDEDMDESDDNVPFKAPNIHTVDVQPEQDPLPDKMRPPIDDDYDLMFLKSLLPYFRELDPVRKLRIRNKMQDIIINEISPEENLNSTH